VSKEGDREREGRHSCMGTSIEERGRATKREDREGGLERREREKRKREGRERREKERGERES
jgi:hypothetical protein